MADAHEPGKLTIACPRCGKQTSLATTICDACGGPLDTVNPLVLEAEGSSGGTSWGGGPSVSGCLRSLLLGVAVVVLVVVVLFGLLFGVCAFIANT